MHTLDLSFFYSIYDLAGHSSWFDWLIIFTGEYLLYPLLLLVVYCMHREWHKGHLRKIYDYAVAVIGSLVARFGLAEIIRFFYHRPRPYIALHLPHLLSDTSYSFPSGHMIFLFALATGVYKINKKLAYWLYGLGTLIGLARVAGGVHYPSDILGGAILGTFTGYVVYQVWVHISHRLLDDVRTRLVG